jgi:sulfate transport system ATP-binding protein
MQIEVRNLVKKFGSFTASNDVSFRIRDGILAGFLGPSGGGKTTILRMLAGLETPDSGDILFDGERVNDLLPQKRGVGFVFQNYALFRHMTVYNNIAFGLTVQKKKKHEIRERVEELIELTGLNGLEKRLPHQLSGGQRQRVAFARALAPEPRLLLLDEPFAAVDAKVRKELRTWLKEMIRRVGITTIFVTHDQEEAVEVADEIIIIKDGRIEQQGTPLEICRQPATPFVAEFVGESNILQGVAGLVGFERIPAGATVLVRPEFVEIGAPDEIRYLHASETGHVRNVSFRGRHWLVDVQIGPHTISGYRSMEQRPLQVGDPVRVLIHRVYFFHETGGGMVENAGKDDPMPVII